MNIALLGDGTPVVAASYQHLVSERWLIETYYLPSRTSELAAINEELTKRDAVNAEIRKLNHVDFAKKFPPTRPCDAFSIGPRGDCLNCGWGGRR